MPTDCNSPRIDFTSLHRRAVHADFDAGFLTSDAGALLLREAAAPLRLFERMAAAIPDPRDPALIEHDQETLLAQRVLGIACGWEDGNDHQALRHDPLLAAACGRAPDPDRPLASPPTLCRLENRVDRQACVDLSRLLVELFIESHPSPPAELVLDLDATDDPVHGQQEGRFFQGCYGGYCFLPLYVFCGDQPLVAYLRSADGDAARHARAVLGLLVARLRRAWPGVRITVRGDSGFCRWKLLRWCDRHGVGYVLGLAKNPRLLRLAQPLLEQAAQGFQSGGDKQRLFGEVAYAAESWDRPRRVLVKAEHGPRGPNPRFVVVSLAGEPQALYDELYCQRGEMENRIKEQQLGLFADRTSCHGWWANQFRLLLSSFAYALIERLRGVGLAGTELARAQAGTIRLKLLKVGALVSVSVRRVAVRLSRAYPLAALFVRVAQRLMAAAAPAAASSG